MQTISIGNQKLAIAVAGTLGKQLLLIGAAEIK